MISKIQKRHQNTWKLRKTWKTFVKLFTKHLTTFRRCFTLLCQILIGVTRTITIDRYNIFQILFNADFLYWCFSRWESSEKLCELSSRTQRERLPKTWEIFYVFNFHQTLTMHFPLYKRVTQKKNQNKTNKQSKTKTETHTRVCYYSRLIRYNYTE